MVKVAWQHRLQALLNAQSAADSRHQLPKRHEQEGSLASPQICPGLGP